jgi:thioredoxin-related protein
MSKIWYFLILSLLILNVETYCQNSSDKKTEVYEPVTKFDPGRIPSEDLKLAIKEAKKTGKRIILDVGGDWCIWCHRLDKFFEDNEEVTSFMMENFLVMKVNFSEENKNEEFLSQFPQIPGYPHFFVLDKEGKLLHSQDTGLLEKGKGHDKEKVMAFLKKWAPKK